ncbi:hypothetical protein SteCoe_18487 [Stentor coeruleus]|uniref:Glycoside hydrolase family 38 central domain-containing protein n=1 Tax=Stentor coeruleus TaxID=5963 RepID=A0A1R2BWI1_9CILI|nr:hypothetical protein SteCoe_18487 [Stentor coeruleus]
MLPFIWILFTLTLGKMNVFFVPHSHNDAGWLETADWYYENKVRHTLDNMLGILNLIPEAKFVWAEIYFLSRYLQDYPEKKPQVISMNKQGRFEIVGGGWVQHDEATVDLEMAIRQTEAGFDYISSELGINEVKIGWQLDPFGHSSLTPALFEKMGIEVLVFSRVEYNFRTQLQNSSNMEFIWKPQGLNSENGVFTHVLNNHYSSPSFLSLWFWDEHCYGQLPANETGVLNWYNIFSIQALEDYVLSTAYKYKTNNQLMLIGDDFYYTDWNTTYYLIDLLVKISEQSTNVNFKFATASEYFDAVLSSSTSFEVFGGDLMPLVSAGSSGHPSYWWKPWTGYYSTKPHIKQLMYNTQKFARIGEIISSSWSATKLMAYEVDMCTHHDAITGTMKEPVYYDYLQRIENDQQMLLNELGLQINNLTSTNSTSSTELMIPYKVLFIINPLNWAVKKTLSLEAASEYVRIFDTSNQTIISQSVPYLDNYKSYFTYELQGLQIKTFFVSEYAYKCDGCSIPSTLNNIQTISNNYITIELTKGLLTSLKTQNMEYFIDGTIVRYDTYMSGPYSFVEDEPAEIICELETFNHYSGSIVDVAESYLRYDQDVFIQRIIVDKITDSFIMTFYVYAERNNDIFYRFHQIYKQKGWFYTFNTANLQKRYFEPNASNKTGHNYYPITGGVVADLGDKFLYFIPTFSLGAGMPFENVFELNLHRHPSYDDQLGIGSYSGDIYPVEHEWIIGFTDLNYQSIWDHFLDHRSSPIVFFNTFNNSLTTNFSLATEYNTIPQYKNTYEFLNNFDCAYLSSLVIRNNSYIFRIFNKCNTQIKVDFTEDFEELNLGGLPLNNMRKFNEQGYLELIAYNNTGKNVLEYPKGDGNDGIMPYEMKTYKLKANGIMDKNIMSEVVGGDINGINGLSYSMIIVCGAGVLGILIVVVAFRANKRDKIGLEQLKIELD